MGVIIQSVSRALRILDTISRYPDGLSIKEIANNVDLNVSTTHHLVGTLESEGCVVRLRNGKYCLGHTISRLYSNYIETTNLLNILREAVEELTEVTQETAYVCTWKNRSALIQVIVEGSQAVRVGGLYVGFMGNTHLRASGKALLAFIDEDELDHYISTADFSPLTANSIRSADQLHEQINGIREQGYAVDEGEFADEVNCVAAPVFTAGKKAIAVLTISAPAGRYIHNEKKYIDVVVQIAKNTSSILGYTAGDRKETT